MARKTLVVLTDDLTGEEDKGVSTVAFSVDGKSFEIDLGDKSRAEFDSALARFIDAARPVRKTRKVTAGVDAQKAKAVREWALATGREVSKRGRVSAALVAEYDAEH